MASQQRFSVSVIGLVATATIAITIIISRLLVSSADLDERYYLSVGAIILAEVLLSGYMIFEECGSNPNRASLPFNIGMSSVLVGYFVLSGVMAVLATTTISLTTLRIGHLLCILFLFIVSGIWITS